MKRKVSKIILASILCASIACPTYAANLQMKIDGFMYLVKSSKTSGDFTMVEMREIFNDIGANLEWDDKSQIMKATKDGTTVQMTVGQKYVMVNGTIQNIPVAPIGGNNGTVYVPLRFVAEAFGANVSWDKNAQMITIVSPKIATQTKTQDYSLLKTDSLVGSKTKVVSYADALAAALKTNTQLSNLQDSIGLMHENMSNAMEDLADASTDKTIISNARNVNSLRIQLANIPLNAQTLKDTTEYTMMQLLTTIANDQMTIQQLNSTIALQTDNLNNLTLKQTQGLASDTDVITAKQTLEQSQTSLASAEIVVKDDRIALNHLLGYQPTDDIVVDYNPTMTPFTADQKRIIASIDGTPTILKLKGVVDDDQYQYDTSRTTLTEANLGQRPESKLQKQNQLLADSRALDDAKTAMQKAIITNFDAIKKLELTLKSLDLDLQKAKTAYNTASINFAAGMNTMYDVNQAKQAILQTEISIAKTIYTLNNLEYAVQRPYLLSSGQ